MAQSNPRLEWLEPAAGTTAFPRVRDVEDTRELVDRLIRDYDTIVVPGHFFQAPQHIRIAFGGRTEMVKEAVSRLDRALAMSSATVRGRADHHQLPRSLWREVNSLLGLPSRHVEARLSLRTAPGEPDFASPIG